MCPHVAGPYYENAMRILWKFHEKIDGIGGGGDGIDEFYLAIPFLILKGNELGFFGPMHHNHENAMRWTRGMKNHEKHVSDLPKLLSVIQFLIWTMKSSVCVCVCVFLPWKNRARRWWPTNGRSRQYMIVMLSRAPFGGQPKRSNAP